ncbi:MAG: hypothetical protein ACO1Q7_09570 [Gemmatimonas sp.]
MRRTVATGLALVVGLILVPAIAIIGATAQPVRVFARASRVAVDSSTGEWSHRYTLTVGSGIRGTSEKADGLDSTIVRVSRSVHDATRVGSHAILHRARLFRRITWLSDPASRAPSFVQLMAAYRMPARSPAPVSPLDAQTAGLARVVAVHSVKLKTDTRARTVDAPQWIHLVEVEFWARSTRALVRTIDVIDAASIPGLRRGTILQMHYDLRDPETVRLDDGIRTFTN